MGLLDLFTKKENQVKQQQPVENGGQKVNEVVNSTQNQNNIVEQTALSTNAVVENPNPMIEQQTALNINLNDVFQGGMTKEDEITQIVSASVNPTTPEMNVIDVSNIPEIAPTMPEENPFQEKTTIETQVNNSEPIQNGTPILEVPTQQKTIIQEQIQNMEIPSVEVNEKEMETELVNMGESPVENEMTPTTITNSYEEQPTIPTEPIVELTSTPKEAPTEPILPFASEIIPSSPVENIEIPPMQENIPPIQNLSEVKENDIEEQPIISPEIVPNKPVIEEINEPIIKEEPQELIIMDETNEPNISFKEEKEEPSYEEMLMEQNRIREKEPTTRFCEKCGEMITSDISVCPNCGEPFIE